MFLLNGKSDETLKALDSLLLTEYESKAYFTLLVKGECKPMDIVRLSGIPRAMVSAALKKLKSRGLVDRIGRLWIPVKATEH